MSTDARILVLSAGLSTPSSTRMLADGLARETRQALAHHGVTAHVDTVELREVAHDVVDMLITRFPSPPLSTVLDALRAADGVIITTPVFNAGPSGLLKSFLDAADPALWHGRPVLLGATAGSARHGLVIDYGIRPIMAHLRADVAATSVFAATGDTGDDGQGHRDATPLDQRMARAARDLAHLVLQRRGRTGLTDAARDAPEADGTRPAAQDTDATGGQPQVAAGLDPEFADFVPMDELLGKRTD
ncbi:CE1759 family FMN reductase [Brachybacterium timonense]|uniref:CE1759 family FMN reductase n=1 Tax=Brachybacterium timonense TaxID=2050896 RepID=UPI000D0B56A4|nr:CE1759 family FMN reductase [Brachybacterium timonense]